VSEAQVRQDGQEGARESKNGVHSLLQPEKMPVNSKGAVLIEASTGQLLIEHNKDQRIEPASFVKVLTLYIVFNAMKDGKIKFSDEVHISKEAWKTGGSQMFIQVDTKVLVEELVKGIAVSSANDACVAIAEHLSGSTEGFVNVMNATAKKLGMKNSYFKNPHGLPDPQQYTTPYDIALLAYYYLQDFPEALRFHSMLEYTYNGITQRNRNGLLRKDESVDGLKTGFTAEARYHLLATAKKHDRRLIAVVMGAESPAVREREARRLLNYGYQNLELRTLFARGEVLAKMPVWKGKSNLVSIVATDHAMITVPQGNKTKFYEDRFLPDTVFAPITKGQVLGKSVLKVDAEVLKSIPLVAEEEIQKAGIIKSISHSVYLMGKNILGIFVVLIAIALSISLLYFFALQSRRKRRISSLKI
jgi:D-alanyl-D-alanine carboxypeptidase (penicillin-binding protein 5/6)